MIVDALLQGLPRRVVIAAHHADAGNTSALRGIAVLDLTTGAPLACGVVDDAGDGEFLLTMPNPSLIVATVHERVALGDPGRVRVVRQVEFDLATLDVTVRDAVLPSETQAAGIASAAIAPHQIIAGWDGQTQLIGVDVLSPNPLMWARNASDLVDGGFGVGFVVARDSSVLVNVAGQSGGSVFQRVLSVDACGRSSVTQFERISAPPMFFEDGHASLELPDSLEPTEKALVVDREVGSFSEPRCHAVAQASETRFACLEIFGTPRLKVLDSDGSNRFVTPLPLLFAGEELGWLEAVSVAADGFVVLLATSREPLGEVTGVRIFIFRDEPDLPFEDSAFLPAGESGLGGYEPALVDRTGVLLVPANGRIHAFSSSLRGLAYAEHPRGPLHGGNDNRGAQALIE